MKTSYFSKYNGKNGISIALSSPSWFKGNSFKKLAPTWSILNEYKKTKNKERYIKRFKKEILSKLDPNEVFNSLGNKAVLLCWEKSGKFCHRRIVAEWLEDNLNIKVPEIK